MAAKSKNILTTKEKNNSSISIERAIGKSKTKMTTRRKRKISENEQRTTWDVDDESTEAILEDMGVSLLDEDSCDGATLNPTPNITIPDINNPPNAPRVPGAPSFSTSQNIPSPSTPRIVELNNDFLRRISTMDKCEENDGQCPFNILSDEMVLSIFKWIPKSMLAKNARVCKRWNRLAFDESLWRRLDLANKVLLPGVMGRLLNRGVMVLRLAKAEVLSPVFTDLSTSLHSSCMSRVQYLDLSMAVVTSSTLEEIFESCQQLKKLSLEHCPLNLEILQSIGENMGLDTLNLAMCSGITSAGLDAIISNCLALESLNLAWTELDRDTIQLVAVCLPPRVTKLNISGCKELLNDEDVLHLCRRLPHLKELDLSDATVLTQATVEHAVKYLHGLEYLALSRCYNVALSSFMLLGGVHTLLAFDVFGMMKDSSIKTLKQNLKNIEINKFPFSSIARPTTGIRRSSVWSLRARDCIV
ncbi:unnamed protein product [Owenia fusiformis]|uniref:Uncharacterized protein n=1 Tax=Owenia fusiformis TaxID=6347 RepID=A0A8J1US42_OWEFU|nr:unnamed protein product [Owenia fusiformis]